MSLETSDDGNITPSAAAADPIDPGVRIGHAHLRTADIDRIRDFYVGVLGFDVVAEARDVPGWGTTGDMLFLSAGGYHHHLGFNTWKSKDGPPQPDGVGGTPPHRARVPDSHGTRRRATAAEGRRLADPPDGRPRHARGDLHLRPDGNDVELMWDRPVDQWPRDERGHLIGQFGDELDLDELLRELDAA